MKYADSFRFQAVQTASGQTTYSPWYDVSWANELYCFLTSVEAGGSASSESTQVKIQRASGYETDVPVDVISFTAITATNTTEEKYAVSLDEAAQGAENKIGHRIRFEIVGSGTWGVTTVTTTINVHAKRN